MTTRNVTRTGVLAVVMAVLIGVLTSACSNPLGKDQLTVTLYLSDSAGLFEGNDVGVLGVPVGSVSEIEPQGDRVKVTIKVDADRSYPADVGAAVVARSVATDRYLELTPVYSGQGPTLEDGAEIPIDRTTSPVDFDKVLEALNTFATGISGDAKTRQAVKRFINAAEKAFVGKGDLFNSTVTDLADVTGTVSGQRENISATIRALDELVSTIAANEGTVREFIKQVNTGAELLNEQRENFRDVLRSMDKSVTTISDFVQKNRQQLISLLGRSNKLFKTMLSKRKELAATLQVFPLALENLKLLGEGYPDRLNVRVPPEYVLPLGGVLAQLCGQLPVNVCDIVARQPATPLIPSLTSGLKKGGR